MRRRSQRDAYHAQSSPTSTRRRLFVRALVDRLGCLETIPARCPDIVHKFVGYRLGPRLGVVQSSSERTPPHIHRWHVETDIRRQIVTLDAFAFANSPIIPSAIAEYYGVPFYVIWPLFWFCNAANFYISALCLARRRKLPL